MTTLAARGSGTPATTGTTWAAVTNAVDGAAGTNPATYATMTNATASAVATITVTGYGFDSAIGASDTLNSVTVALRHLENNTGRFASVRFQAFDGATAIGSAFTATMATAARTDSTTFPVTLAQIRSATFKIVVTITGAASTQSRVFSIDQVDVTADYTIAPPAITQAAYRFYADGTETGSTALANQDTGYTADTSAGDVNLQVRVRLQSTTAIAVPATDDFQLQWEKNTSGTWNAVIVPGGGTSGYFHGVLSSSMNMNVTSGIWRAGQSFIGNGSDLIGASFNVRKSGTPNGTVSAQLFAHSGTFGSSSLATGAALATSTAINCTSLSTTAGFVSFTFDGTVKLTSGTPYVIALVTTNTVAATVFCAYATLGDATDPGNVTYYDGAVWDFTATDLGFDVSTLPSTTAVAYASANLTDGAATTNRLGAGSGSFVAGKVSEDGLVDNLGWTANNHTELLYSVTLIQADLTPSDTLRFRVVKNGSTANLTYSQYPSITIGTAGPQTINGTAVASIALTATAAGTVVAEVVTGTAVASFALDVTAAGTSSAPGAIVTGTAASNITVSVVAAGTVVAEIVTGTATSSLAVTVVATGTVVAEVVTGSAVASFAITVVATGTVVAEIVTGTAVSSVALTSTTTGTRVVGGTSVVGLALTVTAAGTVIAEVVSGTAVTSVALTVVAVGTRVVAGSAVVPVALTVTAAGAIGGITTGTASSSLAITATAVGKRIAVGTASVQLAFASVVVGTRLVRGTTLVPVAVGVTAVGTIVGAPITATASSAVAFVVVAVGTVESGLVGQWNGQTVTAMQWGSQPVEAFTLT